MTIRVFDSNDPPPAGTACSLCKAAGHFCPARGYLGDAAVCPACGDGEPCERTLVITKRHTVEPSEYAFTSSKEERRCTECRGKLGDQAIGTMCWPCRRLRKQEDARAAKRASAAIREKKRFYPPNRRRKVA